MVAGFSGTNAILIDQCQALGDVTVNLAVTGELITVGDGGFTLQLNAYPVPGQRTTVVGKQLNFIQYVIYVDNLNNIGNNTAAFQWQAFSVGATAQPTDPQGTSDPKQVVPAFPQPNALITSVPNNRLPQGSSLTIALTTDPSSHAVTAATFTVQLPGDEPQSVTLDFPASIPYKDTTGKPGVVDAQFPIGGFQVVLVGPGNGSFANFDNGGGILTYTVSPGTLTVQQGPVGSQCGQSNVFTTETSNAGYGTVTPSSAAIVTQDVRTPAFLDQLEWRFCNKCFGMFFDGFPTKGTCPAGGGHSAQGFMFRLPHDVAQTATAQSAWRFCNKCNAMFFDGFPTKGTCPAGGGHTFQGFNFVLPHGTDPSQLDLNLIPNPENAQINPLLEIKGHGFTPNGSFHFTILDLPADGGTTVPPIRVFGTLDGNGSFDTFQDAQFARIRFGVDMPSIQGSVFDVFTGVSTTASCPSEPLIVRF